MDPYEADITGGQDSLTKNGITVAVGDPLFSSLTKGTLTWENTSDGSGLGISGNGSNKVWQPGEVLSITPAEGAQEAFLPKLPCELQN